MKVRRRRQLTEAGISARFRRIGVGARLIPTPIRSLADYFGQLDAFLDTAGEPVWFRGHACKSWELIPSALRGGSARDIRAALDLLPEFRRAAGLRLPRPPSSEDELQWLQLAQHYGLPTRMLDWTENAAIALYFACLRPDRDGLVAMLHPLQLNTYAGIKPARVLDPVQDARPLKAIARLKERMQLKGHSNVALHAIVTTERIQLQRGVFTLHGNRHLQIDSLQDPSLAAFPILSDYKGTLLRQLESIGVDEMAIFPEAEHICSHLKRRIARA